ncbi:MAG: [protein-PII] uridylyltransferase [Candidatus Thioglobus sp.]|nr:[protein-PII] uridylyltransferase [Candidatus Thioglobus sp.]
MQLDTFKGKYQALQNSLKQEFLQDTNATERLVIKRSEGIDELLTEAWREFSMPKTLCLIAVGGYGRGELHFYSDIDLLILIPNKSHNIHKKHIAKFLTFLWDIGLEVGHASRDLYDCEAEISDLSVVTNLLESRFLLGEKQAFLKMQELIKTGFWSSQSFLVGKQKEQKNRHLKYKNSAYILEPNLKESPGGLRDIHTVAWVAKWYFEVNTLADLVDKNYLSKREYNSLKQAQLFLWKLRFGLHILSNRREDRIAFQHQKQLAKMLKYTDGKVMAVEKLMKDYYQSVTKVALLNDILLQLLEDRVLNTQSLNERFVINYGYLQITKSQVFKRQPAAFMEIFLLLAKHNYVRGIGVKTLRQMQNDKNIIDENYHKKPENNILFLELLQQPRGVNNALMLMNRYGILERYIPAFGHIMGLMQYDLFHAYTVDQHTLFVIRNLRRFFVSEFAKEFELCSKIAKTINKPELLLLAGLFHDIGKGRGGNHADLGAVDAFDFCRQHQLKTPDATLVSDLVRQHLLMSETAQKQDLQEPEVIKKFAKTVKSVEFLEYLYLLTVADIRATKADLWNDWKDALLKKLFFATKAYLADSDSAPIDSWQKIDENKQELSAKMLSNGYENQQINQVLDTLPQDYFLRYELSDMLWHLPLVMEYTDKKISIFSRFSKQNVVDIFIHCDDSKGLFFKLVSIIEKLNLNIVDAKILTSKNQKAYNTISVLPDKLLQQINISKVLESKFSQMDMSAKKTSIKAAHRHFDHQPIDIIFTNNTKLKLTKMQINMLDKQGLLSNISYIFYKLNIRLITARITTTGERAEDIFFISNATKRPLTSPQQNALKSMLAEKL